MTYYNFITYEVLLLIMALGVVNFYRHKPKPSYVLGIVSFFLSIYLCVIMFWWMEDTVTYLKWEILRAPLTQTQTAQPDLPIT